MGRQHAKRSGMERCAADSCCTRCTFYFHQHCTMPLLCKGSEPSIPTRTAICGGHGLGPRRENALYLAIISSIIIFHGLERAPPANDMALPSDKQIVFIYQID